MPTSKPSLPSGGRFEHFIICGVLGTAVLALVLLITLSICRHRGSRRPVSIPEHTMVQGPWSRLWSLAQAVATSIAYLLVTRALGIDDRGTGIAHVIKALIEALFSFATN